MKDVNVWHPHVEMFSNAALAESKAHSRSVFSKDEHILEHKWILFPVVMTVVWLVADLRSVDPSMSICGVTAVRVEVSSYTIWHNAEKLCQRGGWAACASVLEESAGGWGVCIMRSGGVCSSQWKQRGFMWVSTVPGATMKLRSLKMLLGALCTRLEPIQWGGE